MEFFFSLFFGPKAQLTGCRVESYPSGKPGSYRRPQRINAARQSLFWNPPFLDNKAAMYIPSSTTSNIEVQNTPNSTADQAERSGAD